MAAGSAAFVHGEPVTFVTFVVGTGVQGSCTGAPTTPKALPFVPKVFAPPIAKPVAIGTEGAGVAKGANDCCLISLMVGLGGVVLKTGRGG